MSYDKFIESSNVIDYSADYYNAKAAHCIKLHESIEKRVALSLIKTEKIALLKLRELFNISLKLFRKIGSLLISCKAAL